MPVCVQRILKALPIAPPWLGARPRSICSCCSAEAITTRIAAPRGFMITVTELLQPVETDLEMLLGDLRSLIGAGHPILQAAAEHLFSAGGKRLRPGIVLLLSRALAEDGQLTPGIAAWRRSQR